MKWIRLCIVFVFLLFYVTKGFSQEDYIVDTAATSITENNFDSFSFHAHPVVERKVSDSVLNSLRNDDDYWYANLAPPKKIQKKREAETPLMDRSWVNTLIWFIIIAGFIAVLIWYLASSNIRLFRKKTVVIDSGEDELITEDIFEINYEKEIQAAVVAGNYRFAIRLMFLRTLRELSERELIQYKNERTNSEYLFQLSGTKYYRDFFRLTRDFEYTWYGKFQLSPEAFGIVQNDFSTFKGQLQ